jgi:hypothetical protein
MYVQFHAVGPTILMVVANAQCSVFGWSGVTVCDKKVTKCTDVATTQSKTKLTISFWRQVGCRTDATELSHISTHNGGRVGLIDCWIDWHRVCDS